jgi:REP element-mobilizing transposase RayT
MVTYPFEPGQSKKLRDGHISEEFACFAISKSVNRRRRVLATPSSARTLMDSWQHLRTVERIKLFAFCIMPDHYHVLFCLLPGQKLSKVMEDFGKFTSRQLNKLLSRQGQFWQEGFHDIVVEMTTTYSIMRRIWNTIRCEVSWCNQPKYGRSRRHLLRTNSYLIEIGGLNRRRRRLPQS